MVWAIIRIIIYIVMIYLAYSMSASKEEQQPTAFKDLKAPTAETGRELSVVFGTVLVQGSNVVWYGDFKSVALT